MSLLLQLQKELNPGCTMMVNNPDEERLFLDYLQPDMRVLEFGMGLSTLAIAKRVKEVISIEDNHAFYKEFKQFLPANVTPVFTAPNADPKPEYDDGTYEDFKDYVNVPKVFANGKFDVVFVDGRARVACAEMSANNYLKPGGKIFIHDYKHPQPQYRRHYLETVEGFLTLEKQAFAMAMFSVKTDVATMGPTPPEHLRMKGTDCYYNENGEGQKLHSKTVEPFDEQLQKIIADQVKELKGETTLTPPEIAEKLLETPAPEEVTVRIPIYVSEPEKTLTISSDTNSCWHQQSQIIEEMNRFYDMHIKGHNIADHLAPFTRLLMATEKQGSPLLDLGCGTAMLSDFCKDFQYVGADLPHVIAGCAMRNYPRIWYRSVNIESDELDWIKEYPVVVLNGVIDVMQYPLEVLKRVLTNAGEYVIIHRQEISQSKSTQSIQKPSYGGYTWHSIINRNEFVEFLSSLNYTIVKEETLSFFSTPTAEGWENGGNSFLLRKRKSWALNEIDYKLAKLFSGKRNGFFVEAGANDGLRQSNTMFLEFYYNWQGILIEPVADLMKLCMENRSTRNLYWQYALVSPDYAKNGSHSIDMYFTPENYGLLSVVIDENADKMMKRIGGEDRVRITANADTFNNIAGTASQTKHVPEHIDLMVLDLEGQELNALKGIDFDKYKIDYLLIEELNGGSEIADYLDKWYYQADKLSDHDVLYKRK